jgi:hypothetical protein
MLLLMPLAEILCVKLLWLLLLLPLPVACRLAMASWAPAKACCEASAAKRS